MYIIGDSGVFDSHWSTGQAEQHRTNPCVTCQLFVPYIIWWIMETTNKIMLKLLIYPFVVYDI